MVSLCFQSTHASPMPPVSPPHKSEITKTPQNIRAQRGTDDATPEGIASRLAGTSTPLPLQSAVAAQSCVCICVPRFHHCRASCPCTLLPLCGASDSIREEGCKRERRQDCGIGRHPRDDLSATPGARGRHLCSCVSQSQRFRRSVVNRHQPAHNPFHHHQQPTGRPQTQARTKPVLPPPSIPP